MNGFIDFNLKPHFKQVLSCCLGSNTSNIYQILNFSDTILVIDMYKSRQILYAALFLKSLILQAFLR